MFRILAPLALALSVTVAMADVPLGSHDRFQTRFGAISVVGEAPSQGLAVAAGALPVELDYMWQILGAWGMEGADHDWVLATHHHGGTMCGPGITVIRMSAAEVRVMGETEPCEGALSDLRVEPQALELDIYADGLRQQFTTYRFDATGMSTTPGAAAFAATPAGGGPDATRWTGQHPSRLFADPGERARFLAILTEDQIRDLADRIGPATPVVERDGWVLGAGCTAHACNISAGAWGIRIADGAPAAAFFDQGAAPRVYGPAAYDPVFAGWMMDHGL